MAKYFKNIHICPGHPLHYHEEIIYDIESTRAENVDHRGSAGLTRLTFYLSPAHEIDALVRDVYLD